MVRTLSHFAMREDGVMAAGEFELAWDAQDGQGRTVAPGVYLVRVQTDSMIGIQPVIRLN